MIIDGHVHLGGPFAKIDDLLQSMQDSGVDKTVVVPYMFKEGLDVKTLNFPLWLVQTPLAKIAIDRALNNRWFRKRLVERPDNAKVAQSLKAHPAKLSGMYWLNPRFAEDIEEMEGLISKGLFSGIKMHQVIHPFDLSDKNVQKIFAIAEKHQVPLFVHLANRKSVSELISLAQKKYRVKIIIAHLMYHEEIMSASHLLNNLYYDISPLCLQKEKKIYDIIVANGVEKLIFGTDAPCPGGQKYAVQKVQSLPIPEEQKRAILGGNLMRLLHLH